MVKTTKSLSLDVKVKDYILRLFHTYGFNNFSETLNYVVLSIIRNPDIDTRIKEEIAKRKT